jgi:hypothetical protein
MKKLARILAEEGLVKTAARPRIYGKHGSAIKALWSAFVPFVMGSTKTRISLYPKKSLGGRTGFVDIHDLARGHAKVHFLAGDIGGLRYSLTNLGHELIHVLQYERGDLQVRDGQIWWEGKPYMRAEDYEVLSLAEHAALPWENEAITKSAQKVRDFLTNRDALWGLDPVLDYLLEDDPDWP